jgi:hypothetical protein
MADAWERDRESRRGTREARAKFTRDDLLSLFCQTVAIGVQNPSQKCGSALAALGHPAGASPEHEVDLERAPEVLFAILPEQIVGAWKVALQPKLLAVRQVKISGLCSGAGGQTC